MNSIDLHGRGAIVLGGACGSRALHRAAPARLRERRAAMGPRRGRPCPRPSALHLLRGGSGQSENIDSIAGKEGHRDAAHDSASGAGVISLTRSRGAELATSTITDNAITPAVIATAILQMSPAPIDHRLSKIPLGRSGEKGAAPVLVVWLCSEEWSFTTAAVFERSGGRTTC